MMLKHGGIWILAAVLFCGLEAVAKEEAFDLQKILAVQYPESTGPFMGDWEGKWSEQEKKDPFLGAQIVGLGGDMYQLNLIPALDHRGEPYVSVPLKVKDGKLTFKSGKYYGAVTADSFIGGKTEGDPKKSATFSLTRANRPSPTLGLEPPENAVVLFGGENMDAWDGSRLAPWGVVDGTLMPVHPKAADIVSKQKFEDVKMHVEFRLPYVPYERGQGRANSGVFLQDEYEIQVLDSYGLPGYFRECGALYKVSAPKVNMCRPPNEWQTYDIEFRTARFDSAGKKTDNPRITVLHNGKLIHSNEEVPFLPTNSYKDRIEPHPQGPGGIRLQAHHNHVQFRNIWVLPL